MGRKIRIWAELDEEVEVPDYIATEDDLDNFVYNYATGQCSWGHEELDNNEENSEE